MDARPARARHPTTQWSCVVAAGGSGAAARKALAALCEAYWDPLYTFARSRGSDPEKAKDLTQGFFARLIEKEDLGAADPTRGRFRTWLLACFKHFMANEWDKDQAKKRPPPAQAVPFDTVEAERRYLRKATTQLPADQLYDRHWALTVVERALAGARARCRTEEEAGFFDRVAPLLALPELPEVEPLAAELGLTAGALKTRVSRLRDRLWGRVRAEIAETLEDPEDVDEELRYLVKVLAATWET